MTEEKKVLDYSRAPGFVAGVATCLLPQLLQSAGSAEVLVNSFPEPFKGKIAACESTYSLSECAQAAAECGAVHYPVATDDSNCDADANPLTCVVENKGFLSCMAHRLDSECQHSPMGAGACLQDGLECVQAGHPKGTTGFQTCMAAKNQAYFAANPAAKSATELCSDYYGDACLSTCLGCAAEKKSVWEQASGQSCEGEHCLRVPSIVSGMIMCMLQRDEGLPTAFKQVEGSCAMAYPEDALKVGLCKKSAAECLALQPCHSFEECAASDGWAACFAHKMDFNECHDHHAGMAACMSCGHHCMGQGCGGTVDTFTDVSACVTCHQGCVAAR